MRRKYLCFFIKQSLFKIKSWQNLELFDKTYREIKSKVLTVKSPLLLLSIRRQLFQMS